MLKRKNWYLQRICRQRARLCRAKCCKILEKLEIVNHERSLKWAGGGSAHPLAKLVRGRLRGGLDLINNLALMFQA